MSYFEMQQEAWMKNLCKGRIEDYRQEDLEDFDAEHDKNEEGDK